MSQLCSETFRRLLQRSYPKSRPPPKAPATVRKFLLEEAADIRHKLQIKFADLTAKGHKVSISFDEATVLGSDRYLTLNVHSAFPILGDSKITTLGLIRVTDSATGGNLKNLIRARLQSVSLELKSIAAAATDGAANVLKAVDLMRLRRQKCFAYGLDLLVRKVVYGKDIFSFDPEIILESHAESGDRGATSDDERNDNDDSSERQFAGEEEEREPDSTSDENEEGQLDGDEDSQFEGDEEEQSEGDEEEQSVGEEGGESSELEADEESETGSEFQQADPRIAVELKGVLERLRVVVRGFKRKPKLMDRLRIFTRQKTYNGRELRPILDCPTRWYSTFVMVERGLLIMPAMLRVLESEGQGAEINPNDIRALEEIAQCLEPFKIAIQMLSRSIATLYHADRIFNLLFLKVQQTTSPLANPLLENLKAEIANRRTILSSILALLTDPLYDFGLETLIGQSKPADEQMIEVMLSLLDLTIDQKPAAILSQAH